MDEPISVTYLVPHITHIIYYGIRIPICWSEPYKLVQVVANVRRSASGIFPCGTRTPPTTYLPTHHQLRQF